jgi:tetratricopeptide (TPR) repeat protein
VLLRFVRDLLGSSGRPGRAVASRSGDRDALARGLRKAQEAETAGDLPGALRVLEQLIAGGAQDAVLFARAAALYGRRGELARARRLLEDALRREPGFVDARVDLGTVARLEGRRDEAHSCYSQALERDPRSLGALSNLGQLCAEGGDVHAAFDAFVRAIKVDPRCEPALRGLAGLATTAAVEAEVGTVLRELTDDATNGLAQAMYGYHLLKRELNAGRALEFFDRALAAGWDDSEIQGNRAIALQDLGRADDALAGYEAALARDPGNRLARWHRSLARLLEHEFETAWDDYELRLETGDWPRPALPYPLWAGSAIPGKTLLLCAEQGLGDEIMFAGCFPDAMARAGRCVIDCHPKLAALFRRSFPQAEIHPGDQREPPAWTKNYEPIDFMLHAGSLPRLYRRSAAAFPAHRGYLRADPARTRAWRERLDNGRAGRPVGISWRGGTAQSRSRLRSLSLEQLLPVLRTPGIRWVSLQYDAQAEELEHFAAEHGVEIAHWRKAIDDYDETAALLGALDLTVSVCTAVVHLGGSLGRPLWVLAPYSPEWRYGRRGQTMPWYPSVRVLRQPAPGEWEPLLVQAARQLADWVASPMSGTWA